MNGNQLLNKFSDVDPKLITGAEKAGKKSRKGLFIGIGSGLAATAAALALVIGLGSVKEPVIDYSKYTHLPIISAAAVKINGQGGNGLDQNHPEYSVTNEELEKIKADMKDEWKEASRFGYGEYQTLPIYLSHSNDPDIDKMKARLLEIISKLGYSESDLKFEIKPPADLDEYRKMLKEWGAPQEEIEAEAQRMVRQTAHMSDVRAWNDDIEFTISTDFIVKISYKTVQPLPEGCSLESEASDEERAKAVDYLYEKYKTLVDYDKTVRIGNEVHNNSSFAESKLEYIEFYDFSYGSDAKGFNTIRINSAGGCDLLGDYPIMTAKAAEAVLKSENTPEEDRLPEDAEVIGVEFVYPASSLGDTGLVPYYIFWAVTGEKDGKVIYSSYKIYAVPERYIDIDTENYGVRA